jgi:acyl-CoA synthetase (NDP forming)
MTMGKSELVIGRGESKRRTLLTEVESKDLLREAGILIIETKIAASREEAISISKKLGFPVVIKIVAQEIVHKSDIGGVKLDLKTSEKVAKAYDEILSVVSQRTPKVIIEGVSVQRMARPGVEVIIGMTKDPQFGPVLMFGLGGILVEILSDVSFRIVPLERRDARDMIREIKGYPLLEGYRGKEPVDISTLEDILLNVSGFVERHPEVKEIDLNPIFAYPDGAIAVDARVILEETS